MSVSGMRNSNFVRGHVRIVTRQYSKNCAQGPLYCYSHILKRVALGTRMLQSTRGHVVRCVAYIDAHVSMCEVMPENGGLIILSGENFRFSSAFFADLSVEWMKLTSRISLDKTFFQKL